MQHCKMAVNGRYTRERFTSGVDRIIREALKELPDELRRRFTDGLRTYATQTYARLRELLILRAAFLVALLAAERRRDPLAATMRARMEQELDKEYTESPAFVETVKKINTASLPTSYSPTGLPLDMYHKDYQAKVRAVTERLIRADAKEDYSTNVNLRNIAEMQVRYDHQIDMIQGMRESGTKLVWIVPHANCSERCQKYQVGGTKHPSGLYSLDGTKGKTPEGVEYLPLEFATQNPDDLYTTAAGKTYQNGCLTGFNCRHKLKAYAPGNKPVPVDKKEIERRREVEEKQRRYERQIREYRRGAILCDGESRKKKALLKEKAAAKYEEYRKYCVDNKVAMYPERTKLVGIGDESY